MANIAFACLIVALIFIQRLHLVARSDDSREVASDFNPETTATSGVDQASEIAADDGDVTELVGSSPINNDNYHNEDILARSLNLRDLWSSSAKFFRQSDETKEEPHHITDSKDDSDYNNDGSVAAEFQQDTKDTGFINEDRQATSEVYVTKIDHSKEVDEPRVIKGFGLGLGNGLIG